MKTIILNVPLLIGDTHRPAGFVLDACDGLARRLLEAGHAAPFTPTDGHGSGTIEVAAARPAPRKAARISGKAE